MHVVLIVIASLIWQDCVAIDGMLVDKYCREKDRLIASEENDEYLLVGAKNKTNIMLACHYCRLTQELANIHKSADSFLVYSNFERLFEDPNFCRSNEHKESQPKIWYYQDRYQEQPEKEVELGMDNNVLYSRIYTAPDFSLVVKNFAAADAGIYRCHGEAGQEEENKYNYRIEPILKTIGGEFVERGNITEWEKYREIYLWPVTMRFAVSKMRDLAEIRETGVILQVISEWSPWSPCKQCINDRGIKTSRGYCRLKRNINLTEIMKKNDSIIVHFFQGSPMLPCKSVLLQNEFPSISRVIRHLPEFILTKPCKKCPLEKKRRKGGKFYYVKRYVLAEGAHLAVSCPEASTTSQVIWKKDMLTLKKGTVQSFRKKDEQARVMVDTFSTLYLTDVSNEEQGNYTCYVDKINMMRLRIVVVSKTRLLTQAFFRHLGYLGFIICLTSICYCAGVIMTCRQKNKFQPLPQDEPSEEEVE